MTGKIVWVENSQELTEILAPIAIEAGYEVVCHHEYGPSVVGQIVEDLRDAVALILDLEFVPGLGGQIGRRILRELLEDETLGERFESDHLRLGVLSAHLIDRDFVDGVEGVARERNVRPIYMPKSSEMTKKQFRGRAGLEVEEDRIATDFISFISRLTDSELLEFERRGAIDFEMNDPWQHSWDDYLTLPEIAQFALFDAVASEVGPSNQALQKDGKSWVLYCGSPKPFDSGFDPAAMPDTSGRREIATEQGAPCFGFRLTELEQVESIDTPVYSDPCTPGSLRDYPFLGLNLGGGPGYRDCHYDSGSPRNYVSNEWLRESGLVLAADEFVGQESTHFSLTSDDSRMNRIRAAWQAPRTLLRIADWEHEEAYVECPQEGDTSRIKFTARVIQNWSDWTHAIKCSEMGCQYLELEAVCARRQALLGRALLRDNKGTIDELRMSAAEDDSVALQIVFRET